MTEAIVIGRYDGMDDKKPEDPEKDALMDKIADLYAEKEDLQKEVDTLKAELEAAQQAQPVVVAPALEPEEVMQPEPESSNG